MNIQSHPQNVPKKYSALKPSLKCCTLITPLIRSDYPTPPVFSPPICHEQPPARARIRKDLDLPSRALPYTQNRWPPPAHRPKPRLSLLDDVTSPGTSLATALTASGAWEPERACVAPTAANWLREVSGTLLLLRGRTGTWWGGAPRKPEASSDRHSEQFR